MSHFEEEDSPWAAAPSRGMAIGGFMETEDTDSPWAHAAESGSEGEDPYGSQYGHAQDPQDHGVSLEPPQTIETTGMTETSQESSNPLASLTQDRSAAGPEFVPSENKQPPPALSKRTLRSPRRARTTRTKAETVSEADPLGAESHKISPKKEPVNIVAAEFSEISLGGDPADEAVHRALGTGEDSDEDTKLGDNLSKLSDSEPDSAPDTAPKFEVNVGDPVKVGELTNAYTIYTINTSTSYAGYPEHSSVTRRYNDFRWLYRTLERNNPGVIVPPPPEKQAVGRFNDDFVRHRRAALEVMLRKTLAHQILRDDPNTVAFLTSDDFSTFVSTRPITEDELELQQSSTASGLMGSLSGVFSTRIEGPDADFNEAREELETMEVNLKALLRSLELLNHQRTELSSSIADFAAVTDALGRTEPTQRLGKVLTAFAEAQRTLSSLYSRQQEQDGIMFASTLEEHLQLVGSVRDALNSKQRTRSAASAANNELERKKKSLEKLQSSGRSQNDRMSGLESEIKALELKCTQLTETAESTSALYDRELKRVGREKVADFRNSVELFLENAIETQKQGIEIWETFYGRFFASTV